MHCNKYYDGNRHGMLWGCVHRKCSDVDCQRHPIECGDSSSVLKVMGIGQSLRQADSSVSAGKARSYSHMLEKWPNKLQEGMHLPKARELPGRNCQQCNRKDSKCPTKVPQNICPKFSENQQDFSHNIYLMTPFCFSPMIKHCPVYCIHLFWRVRHQAQQDGEQKEK